jgi:hypothetical protein
MLILIHTFYTGQERDPRHIIKVKNGPISVPLPVVRHVLRIGLFQIVMIGVILGDLFDPSLIHCKSIGD